MTTPTQVTAIQAESIDTLVGRRVHTLMWSQRVKNKEIGELLGVDPTAIGKKLRAEQKFSIEQLRTVASRLGTTIAYLVGESDDPASPHGSPATAPLNESKQTTLAPVTRIQDRRNVA